MKSVIFVDGDNLSCELMEILYSRMETDDRMVIYSIIESKLEVLPERIREDKRCSMEAISVADKHSVDMCLLVAAGMMLKSLQSKEYIFVLASNDGIFRKAAEVLNEYSGIASVWVNGVDIRRLGEARDEWFDGWVAKYNSMKIRQPGQKK